VQGHVGNRRGNEAVKHSAQTGPELHMFNNAWVFRERDGSEAQAQVRGSYAVSKRNRRLISVERKGGAKLLSPDQVGKAKWQ